MLVPPPRQPGTGVAQPRRAKPTGTVPAARASPLAHDPVCRQWKSTADACVAFRDGHPDWSSKSLFSFATRSSVRGCIHMGPPPEWTTRLSSSAQLTAS